MTILWHQHLCFVLSVGEFGMFDRNVRQEKLNALITCKTNPKDAMDANVRVKPLPHLPQHPLVVHSSYSLPLTVINLTWCSCTHGHHLLLLSGWLQVLWSAKCSLQELMTENKEISGCLSSWLAELDADRQLQELLAQQPKSLSACIG